MLMLIDKAMVIPDSEERVMFEWFVIAATGE
jgi:hypothetical protein